MLFATATFPKPPMSYNNGDGSHPPSEKDDDMHPINDEIIGRTVRIRASVALCATLGAVVLLVAACNGTPPAPGVASAGVTTTTDPPSQSAGSSKAADQSKLLAYSHCMQAHGIKDFPDPNGGGLQITGGLNSDLNPNNPLFTSAQNACKSLMPQPTAAQKAQALKDGLKMATCMRAHGLKDFPDPTSDGRISINASPGSDLNPNNPLFQTAQNACGRLLPGAKSLHTSNGGGGNGPVSGSSSSGSSFGVGG